MSSFYRFVFCLFLSLPLWLHANEEDDKLLDSLLLQANDPNAELRIDAYLSLADFYLFKDSTKSSKYLNKVNVNISTFSDSLRRDILYKKVEILKKANRNDEAIGILKKELEIASSQKDSMEMASIHKNISSCYFYLNEYDSANIHIKNSTQLFLMLKDSINYGIMLLRKGSIAYSLGDYAKAIDYGSQAKEIFLSVGKDRYLASAYMQMGNIYYFVKNFEDAYQNYEIASKYYLEDENLIGEAICMINMGLVREEQGRFLEGLELQKKALPKILKEGQILQHSQSYNLIAGAFYELKEYDSAKFYLIKSLEIDKKYQNKLGMSEYYLLNANIHYDFKRLDSALIYALKAEELLENEVALEMEKDIYELLFLIYDEIRNDSQALKYLKLHHILADSLSMDERSLQSIAMKERTKLDSAKFELQLSKQREVLMIKENKVQRYYLMGISLIAIIAISLVVLLSRSNKNNYKLNRELRAKQVLVQEDLELKKSLLKEIHHRVKNNLQIISSMLSIQNQYIDDEHLKEIITECRNRISSMSLIHESLYRREDMSNALFSNYIKSLIPQLLETYHIEESKIKLEMELEDVQLSLDDSIPAGLIINEIVSNSLKHAFPDDKNGVIFLKFSAIKEKLQLIITDNGIGIPKDVDKEDAESFGLLLINLLASQLGASIQIDTHKGTKYTLEWESKEDKMLI